MVIVLFITSVQMALNVLLFVNGFTCFIDVQTSKELTAMDIKKMMIHSIFAINDKYTHS